MLLSLQPVLAEDSVHLRNVTIDLHINKNNRADNIDRRSPINGQWTIQLFVLTKLKQPVATLLIGRSLFKFSLSAQLESFG